jgi:hypothetical protein
MFADHNANAALLAGMVAVRPGSGDESNRALVCHTMRRPRDDGVVTTTQVQVDGPRTAATVLARLETHSRDINPRGVVIAGYADGNPAFLLVLPADARARRALAIAVGNQGTAVLIGMVSRVRANAQSCRVMVHCATAELAAQVADTTRRAISDAMEK